MNEKKSRASGFITWDFEQQIRTLICIMYFHAVFKLIFLSYEVKIEYFYDGVCIFIWFFFLYGKDSQSCLERDRAPV